MTKIVQTIRCKLKFNRLLVMSLLIGVIISSSLALPSISMAMRVRGVHTGAQYTVTATTSGQGSVSKSPSQTTYTYGSTVKLTATPSSGWSFTGWSGSVSGPSNPITVTVKGNIAVTATFTQNTYTIVASAGSGGSISPSGSVVVSQGSSQVFTITPSSGYQVSSVLVDGSSVGAVSSYAFSNIQAAHTISTSFTQVSQALYTVTFSIVGQGSVSKSPDQASYASGSSVQLTATPSSGWEFSGWSGNAMGSSNPISITVISNMAVTATFTQNTYTITVTVSPSTGGTVTNSPSQSTYHYGDVVTLTESPSAGYTFSAWSGDGTGTGSTRTVTVTGNMAVTATFTSSGGLSPLHVEGNLIKDSNENTVILRGVNKGFTFCDDNSGSFWMGVAGWNPTRASQELDIMKSWGCNVVRIHECYEYWIQNTVDPVSGLTHRQIVHDFASLCNQKGLYVIIDGFAVLPYGQTGNRQTPLPFPPDETSYELAVIPNAQTWINMWSSAASALKDLPNVIIEPHNEPHADTGQDWPTQRALWFTNLQSCITAIRGTGFAGLIVYQWDYGSYTNLDFPWTSYTDLTQGTTSAWVYNYPLTDPLNNLVVSDHQYWDGGELGMWTASHGAGGSGPYAVYPSTYADILSGITNKGILYVLNTLHKPVIIGEFGADVVWSNQTLMQTAFTNQLQVYNDLGISYCAFWFRSSGVYALTTSDGSPAPNTYGTILRNKIAG